MMNCPECGRELESRPLEYELQFSEAPFNCFNCKKVIWIKIVEETDIQHQTDGPKFNLGDLVTVVDQQSALHNEIGKIIKIDLPYYRIKSNNLMLWVTEAVIRKV